MLPTDEETYNQVNSTPYYKTLDDDEITKKIATLKACVPAGGRQINIAGTVPADRPTGTEFLSFQGYFMVHVSYPGR